MVSYLPPVPFGVGFVTSDLHDKTNDPVDGYIESKTRLRGEYGLHMLGHIFEIDSVQSVRLIEQTVIK